VMPGKSKGSVGIHMLLPFTLRKNWGHSGVWIDRGTVGVLGNDPINRTGDRDVPTTVEQRPLRTPHERTDGRQGELVPFMGTWEHGEPEGTRSSGQMQGIACLTIGMGELAEAWTMPRASAVSWQFAGVTGGEGDIEDAAIHQPRPGTTGQTSRERLGNSIGRCQN
jgi:hypothetical protein